MILGACSLCGGSVEQYEYSPFAASKAAPRPKCRCCGATTKCKVIEMDANTISIKQRNTDQIVGAEDNIHRTNTMDDSTFLSRVGNG